MARTIKPLTATQINQAKPKTKDYKLSDGGGLFLLITKRATKLWRMKYIINKKEKLLSLGTYPNITLSKARELREENKQLIANGTDPNKLKQREKAKLREVQETNLNTLDNITDNFFQKIEESATPKYLKKLRSYYNNHVKSTLGATPIKEIHRANILSIVDIMQDKGIYESTKKTLNLLERIFKYAIAREYTEHNIIADFDKKLILKKKTVRHHPTITDDKTIKLLLESIDNYTGEIVTKH